jgi:prepilin-type N-terminal cleavage/methylation domain-containing protein
MMSPPPAESARKAALSAGFTLIEMSIVLVIIGLIVGGILVGQQLILAATLRAQVTQIEGFKTAVATFRGKYNCIPGDCANATLFFPADPSCRGNATRSYLAAANGLTCNGNGDGIIDNAGTANYDAERNLFWQHLSLAGLVPGAYTGTCGYAGADCQTNSESWQAGVNAPAATIGRGAMITVDNTDIAGSYGMNTLVLQGGQDVFWLSGPHGTDGSHPIWSGYPGSYMAFTGNELFALDTKYDDGLPTSGYITVGAAFCGNVATQNMCFDGSQTPPAYYTSNVSSCGVSTPNVLACDAMFKAGF